jgi:hypothetical protein
MWMMLASIRLRCAMSGSSESYGATSLGRLHQTAQAHMRGQQDDDGLSGMLFRLCPVNKSTHSRAVSLRWSVISFGIVPSRVWMPVVYLGSIEPRMSVVLDCVHWNWIAKNPMSMNRR